MNTHKTQMPIMDYIAVLNRMGKTLTETAHGKSFARACQDNGIDYSRFYYLLKSKGFKDSVLYTDLIPLESAFPALDSYESMYMAVFDGDFKRYYKLPVDYRETMRAVLAELSDRERDIFTRISVNCESLEEIEQIYNVTKSRILQIHKKAIRKLRTPERRKLLTLGLAEYNYRKALQDRDTEVYITAKSNATPRNILDMPIGDMDFSVRTYNCLARAGKKTLKDIAGMTDEELLKVRNMGRKSVNEVKTTLAHILAEGKA